MENTNWNVLEKENLTFFWNNETHEQMMHNSDDESGALSMDLNGISYKGCWTSRPEVIRAECDKGFVGKNEYVDKDGKVWFINISKSSGVSMSQGDDGIDKPTNEVLRTW